MCSRLMAFTFTSNIINLSCGSECDQREWNEGNCHGYCIPDTGTKHEKNP